MNFKHLYYFWMTVRAGGVLRAGERLNITPQTLSGQIKRLEARLGCRLFERSGRNVRPTEAGRIAVAYAERIFGLGQQLEGELRGLAGEREASALKVGIDDSVPKVIAQRMLEPFASECSWPGIECREGSQRSLLADLDVHRLDVVLTSAIASDAPGERRTSYRLGRFSLAVFAAPGVSRDELVPFPRCLDAMPMLMPAANNALRAGLEEWFAAKGVSPTIAAELSDWGVMTAIGQYGGGAFVAPALLATELHSLYGVELIGHIDGVVEEFYAVAHERHICHPWVRRIIDAVSGVDEDGKPLSIATHPGHYQA